MEIRWCGGPNPSGQLRQLPIHPELVTELWCHHWTALPPRLPVTDPQGGAGASVPAANQQQSLPARPLET